MEEKTCSTARKTWKKTICPLDCPDSCGLVATVEGNRVTALAGDPEHPYTRGVICRKMRRYPARVAPANRILYPGLRTGRKGEGQFRRVSWQEALAHIANRLHRIRNDYGGEAILPFVYAGNMGYLNRFAGYPLFHKLGATRLLETICSATAGAGWQAHCGEVVGNPPEKAAEADLIVAWGINVKVSNLHLWPYIASARKRGAKLLVIDPYRNQTAQSADIHVRVRPAGDSALALGICKALWAEAGIDTTRLGQWTTGWEEFLRHLEKLGWAELEAQSGISRREMEDLAFLMGKTPKTFIRIGIGMTRNSRGAMGVRAIVSLGACLDLFSGKEGRGVLLTSRAFRGDSRTLTHPELMQGQPRTLNMIHLAYGLNSLDPPIKALVVYNANPASTVPDTSLLRKGLEREDLFTVVHEQVMTPTARYADVVLPATTFLENRDLYTGYGHFYLGCTSPVVAPPGEAKSNVEFFRLLAREMGFDDGPLLESAENRLVSYLETVEGIGAGEELQSIIEGKLVKSARIPGNEGSFAGGRKFHFFATSGADPGGCARLIPGGEIEDPDLVSRFPYLLLSPPHPDLLNSTFGELYADTVGTVLVNPADAKREGIRSGSMVWLANHRGRSRRQVVVTDDTAPGLLVSEGIYWGSSDTGGINDLTSQKEADLGRGGTFHECRVGIRLIDTDGG